MSQDESSEVKEFRRQMREGRTPLIEACRAAYQPYLIARRSWMRKNDELRDQVSLLNNEFSTKGNQLRKSSHKSEDSGAGMVELYKELSQQAKAVSSLIDKELLSLAKLYEPVGKLYDTYKQALDAYNAYMATWKGKVPDSDLSGRALELALDPITKSLR